MKDYFGYKDKVCIVTGASNGMGKATAEMLVELGAKVYSVSRRASGIEGVAMDIICNVAEKAQIDAAFKSIPDKIDCFFGIAGVSGLRNSLVETFKINFVANKYITEEYLSERLRDGGSIVFCTSSGGLGWELEQCKAEYIGLMDKKGWEATVAEVERMAVGLDNLPGPMYYGVSKRAMNYYVAYILERFAERKIRVNAILPMGTDTGLRDDFASMAGDLESMIENGTGLAHRLSAPREMAEPMVFLGSAMASFLDGVYLSADFGMKALIDAGFEANIFDSPNLIAF